MMNTKVLYQWYSSLPRALQTLSGPESPNCRDLTITLRHITFGRTPLDEWSARRTAVPDNTQHFHETDMHAAGGIRNRNPWKLTDASPRLDRVANEVGSFSD